MAQLTVPRARRVVVAMKPETTYGTDVFGGTYVAADIIPAFDIRPAAILQEIENLTQGGQLGRLPSIIGLESATVAFSVNLRGKGVAYAAGTRPEVDLAFRGCSLLSTVDATGGAEKVTYVPTDTHEAMSIYVAQENGPALRMAGCHGTFTTRMTAGNMCVATFTFSGKLVSIADTTFVAATLSGTPQYPVMKSAAFQIGTENYAPKIAQMGFDMNAQVLQVQSINDASGLAGFIMADRNPRVTMDPMADTLANYPWFTKWKASTLADSTWQVGTTQYDRIKFTMLALQIVSQTFAARDGVTTFPTTLLASLTSGNDDFSIVFD